MRFLAAASPLLATLLLLPLATSAQNPLPAKTIPQKVSIQVTFVTVKAEDLDALGINFNLIPLPASPRTFIAVVEGNMAAQLYQTLTHTAAHIGSHIITLAPITVPDNVPAVFAVNTQVPMDAMPLPIDQGRSDFPQLTGSIQLRGKITLIPQVAPGNLVGLDIISPIDSSQRMHFCTIPSGQQVAMNAKAYVEPQNSINQGQIEGLSGHGKVSHTIEFLIFIMPTIVTQTVMAAPVVNPQKPVQPEPQAQFSGSAASFLSRPSGFGLGRPSDVLSAMQWLNSLHWPGGSNIDGTMGRQSLVIEAPPLPSGVKRIYAL